MDNENNDAGVDASSVDNTQDAGDTTETVSISKAEYDKMVQEHGSFKRELKDLKKQSKEVKETPTAPTASDLGEKAFLAVNGIKTPEQIEFFQKMKKETGRDAETLIGSTYFQAEFKDFNEKRASADATPTASNRSNNSQVDTVEYWLAKDELPPVSEPELRRKVVNARIAKDSSKGVFYNSSK